MSTETHTHSTDAPENDQTPNQTPALDTEDAVVLGSLNRVIQFSLDTIPGLLRDFAEEFEDDRGPDLALVYNAMKELLEVVDAIGNILASHTGIGTAVVRKTPHPVDVRTEEVKDLLSTIIDQIKASKVNIDFVQKFPGESVEDAMTRIRAERMAKLAAENDGVVA